MKKHNRTFSYRNSRNKIKLELFLLMSMMMMENNPFKYKMTRLVQCFILVIMIEHRSGKKRTKNIRYLRRINKNRN